MDEKIVGMNDNPERESTQAELVNLAHMVAQGTDMIEHVTHTVLATPLLTDEEADQCVAELNAIKDERRALVPRILAGENILEDWTRIYAQHQRIKHHWTTLMLSRQREQDGLTHN